MVHTHEKHIRLGFLEKIEVGSVTMLVSHLSKHQTVISHHTTNVHI
jgi:hypothetical protein